MKKIYLDQASTSYPKAPSVARSDNRILPGQQRAPWDKKYLPDPDISFS